MVDEQAPVDPPTGPLTMDELLAYHRRLMDATTGNDNDAWDSIFVEYMKEVLARDSSDDSYLAIAAFVRGSSMAAFKFGMQMGEKSERTKRKRRKW